MSNYSTALKTWGSTGQVYPDGYGYLENERPIDSWDNYFNYNVIEDLDHLVDLTNSRVESEYGSAGGEPASPEASHIYHDLDAERLNYWDTAAATWHGLMKVDGDAMEGTLDLSGNPITDTARTGVLEGDFNVNGDLSVHSTNIDTEYFGKQEGGTLPAGSIVPIGTFGLDNGETLKVLQAMLTADGFTTPAPSGINLVVVADDDNNTTGPSATILSGNGSTLHDDVEGTDSAPVAEYTNTTGGHQTVAIALNNGDYGQTGSGSEQVSYGGYIARLV